MAEFTIDDELLAAAENDLETTVGEEFDPDADYAAAPPPLPDGWHQARLVNLGVKVNDVQKEFDGPRPWGPNIKTYYTRVEAQVVDPGGPQNNKKATGNVTTHNEKTQDGTVRGSAAAMYYRAITGEPIPGVSQGAHIAAVARELRGEPVVWVRTRLEGQDSDAAQAFNEQKRNGTLETGAKKPPTFRGQKEFTQDGKLTGVKVVDGVRIVARPIIQEVKHISFTPPTPRGK